MKTLNDLFTQTSGKALKKSNQNGSLHKYITTSNLFWGRFDFSEVREMYFMENELEKCTAKKGDLLVCNGGDVGRSAVWEYDYDICLQNHITRLRPKSEDVFPKFYYYAMYYIKNNELINGNGVGIASLSAKELMSIKVPHPSLPEQQKIAAHLDSIQSAIDNKKQQLQQLDELVKSKFVEMFGETPVESGKWKVETLGNVAEIGSSKRIFASEYVSEGIPFYRSKEIIELSKKLKPSVELFISEERYNEIKEKNGVPELGDILMTAVGTIGKFWEVDTDNPFYYKDGNLVYIRCKSFNSTYFKYCLENLVEEFKQKNIVGSAYSALTIDRLKQMIIPVVDINLQNTFAEYVQKIDSAKSIIKTQLADLQELLDSKMDEYFGE